MQRVVNVWNRLSSDVVLAPSVCLFKQRLDVFWKEKGYGYEQKNSLKQFENRVPKTVYFLIQLYVYPLNK